MVYHADGHERNPDRTRFSGDASASDRLDPINMSQASEIAPNNDALQHEKILFEIYFVFKMIVRIFGARKLQLKLFIL